MPVTLARVLVLAFLCAAPLQAAEPPDPFQLRALLTSGNFDELERLITDCPS